MQGSTYNFFANRVIIFVGRHQHFFQPIEVCRLNWESQFVFEFFLQGRIPDVILAELEGLSDTRKRGRC